MSLNFSSMIQSLITTQLASAAAKKDAAAMARQMGVQGRYFLPYGNQSTGGTGGSSGGFSALALLSFWPMAQSFLQEIISAGISAKQQAQSGNTPGNNPSTNPSDSAVESGKQKDIDKSEKNRLQQQYRDSEVTSQLIGGPDWESPDGEFSFDNLKNAATGKSMAAENMNNYKANADGVKNAASKVSGNATGSDAKAINEGITALNNSIKENGLSSITLLYTGFTPENKFTNPDPDNPIKIEDIQTEKKGVNTELNNIEKDRTAYKAVIDYKKFDANDSRINFGEEKITYTNKDGTTVEIDYTPGMSLPEDIKDDATAKTNFNTQKNNFETKRSETVKKMNEQLEGLKEKAKAEQGKLDTQHDLLTQYLSDLDSVKLEQAEADRANADSYLKALNDGKPIETVSDILDMKQEEQDKAIKILVETTDLSETDIREAIKSEDPDASLDTLLDGKDTEKLKTESQKAEKGKADAMADLQLLDFATEKHRDLGEDSDITRANHKKLQNYAREIMNDDNIPADEKWGKLQNKAASMGITLDKPSDASLSSGKNGKNTSNDTDGDGVQDNWTTKATDGVKIDDFISASEFTTEERTAIEGELSAKSKQDGIVTSSEATKIKQKAGAEIESYKSNFKASMGDLEALYNSYKLSTSKFKLEDEVPNNNQDDKFTNHISSSEDKKIRAKYDKALKSAQNEAVKIEKNNEKLNKEIETNKKKFKEMMTDAGIHRGDVTASTAYNQAGDRTTTYRADFTWEGKDYNAQGDANNFVNNFNNTINRAKSDQSNTREKTIKNLTEYINSTGYSAGSSITDKDNGDETVYTVKFIVNEQVCTVSGTKEADVKAKIDAEIKKHTAAQE